MSFNELKVDFADYVHMRDQADALRDEVVKRRETCRVLNIRNEIGECSVCGSYAEQNDNFCPNCGREIER